MIFIKIKTKANIRKALDQEYMLSFFQKRKQDFLPANENLINCKIDLIRNFRNKFRNMSLQYELTTNKGKRIVRARTHKYQDIPKREWNILNYLKKSGFGKSIPQPLAYLRPLNMFFYLEASGCSFEELLCQRKIGSFLKFTPLIAKWLSQIHCLNKKLGFLPIKTLQEQRRERRHWFFLVRKCVPKFYPCFSHILKEIWGFKQKNKDLSVLVHGDFHWGNIIKIHPVKSAEGGAAKPQFNRVKNQFKVIDIGTCFLGDPLEDVGGFLAQNDSMFRYYAPRLKKNGQKIREVFLKNYFRKTPTKSQKVHLLYFEIQKILEMAAILGFLEPNEESKNQGMKRLLTEAEKKLGELSKIYKNL